MQRVLGDQMPDRVRHVIGDQVQDRLQVEMKHLNRGNLVGTFLIGWFQQTAKQTREITSTGVSVTSWLDYFFSIWPF